jgi:hypothetical protein
MNANNINTINSEFQITPPLRALAWAAALIRCRCARRASKESTAGSCDWSDGDDFGAGSVLEVEGVADGGFWPAGGHDPFEAVFIRIGQTSSLRVQLGKLQLLVSGH